MNIKMILSAKELAILCGAAIIGYAIKEKYNIAVEQDNKRLILKK